jgi:hypothetical protein
VNAVPPELTPDVLERLRDDLSTEELLALVEEVIDGAEVEQLFAIMRSLVGAASDDQLEKMAADRELRPRLFDEIMARMPGQLRPDKAKDLDAVVHWKIFDHPDGGYDHYELVIENGACRLSETPEHEPRVTFRLKPAAFLRLITGHASGMRLALRGRLQVVGDVAFASRVNSLFEYPDA